MTLQVLAAALATALAASSAPRTSPLRVLVLVGGERERQLASRVEGHTADLDVEIATADAPLLLGSDRPVDVALSAAAARAAEVAVWFTPEIDGWVVHVARGDRVFRRRVGQSTGAMSESACTESAALVVRTAVKGIAAGEEIPEGEPEPAPAPLPLRPWGEVGWAGVLERKGPAGRHGVAGRVGGARGGWRLAAAVSYHPAAEIASPSATIRVDRLMAGVMAGVDLLGRAGAGSRWRLGPELTASAARFSRTTAAVGSGLAPTSARAIWTPVVTPAVGASLRLGASTWVGVTLGADVLGRRPEFGVEAGNGFEVVTSLWAVAPRATLSLLIDAF